MILRALASTLFTKIIVSLSRTVTCCDEHVQFRSFFFPTECSDTSARRQQMALMHIPCKIQSFAYFWASFVLCFILNGFCVPKYLSFMVAFIEFHRSKHRLRGVNP